MEYAFLSKSEGCLFFRINEKHSQLETLSELWKLFHQFVANLRIITPRKGMDEISTFLVGWPCKTKKYMITTLQLNLLLPIVWTWPNRTDYTWSTLNRKISKLYKYFSKTFRWICNLKKLFLQPVEQEWTSVPDDILFVISHIKSSAFTKAYSKSSRIAVHLDYNELGRILRMTDNEGSSDGWGPPL